MTRAPHHQVSKHVYLLTKAEIEFLKVAQTAENLKVAAAVLGISHKTAINRIATIREKLGASTTQEAVDIWKGRDAA